MSEQLSLFENKVIPIKSAHELYEAIRLDMINAEQVIWANNRSYCDNDASVVILPVDKITSIPAWRNMCNPEAIDVIEKSPKANLFVRLYDGIVLKASDKLIDLLSYPDVTAIYPYYVK